MRRPAAIIRLKCKVEECKEQVRFEFQTVKEWRTSHERDKYEIRKKPWYCVEHSYGDRVLSPTNKKVEWTSPPSYEETYGKFWLQSGVMMGDGYYAKANAFPAGTRIRITAEVLLPGDAEESKE